MVKEIRKTSSVTYSNFLVWHIKLIIGASREFSVAFGLNAITNEQLKRYTWNIVGRWIINVLLVRNMIFLSVDNFIRDGSEKL
jgi:hypothetical protein